MLYEVITSCDGKAIEVLEPKIKYAGYLQCDSTVLKRESNDRITSYNVCYTKLLRTAILTSCSWEMLQF